MTFKTNVGNVNLDHNIVKGLYWNWSKKEEMLHHMQQNSTYRARQRIHDLY